MTSGPGSLAFLIGLWVGLWIGLCPMPAIAQDQAAARSVIVYVETSPANASDVGAALQDYVSASSAEPGAVSVQCLQERPRPGRFVLAETWRDQTSLDTHLAGSRRVLEAKLRPRLLAPFDERVGLYLASEQAHPPTVDSLHVVVHVDVVPEGRELAAAWLRQQASAAIALPGAQRFEVAVQANRTNHFEIHEIWASAAAYQAYKTSALALALRERLMTIKGAPFDDRFFTTH